jgi:hypothetical protein
LCPVRGALPNGSNIELSGGTFIFKRPVGLIGTVKAEEEEEEEEELQNLKTPILLHQLHASFIALLCM